MSAPAARDAMAPAASTVGQGPHAGRRILATGAPLGSARLALVMLHGRGGAPEDMIGLAEHLAVPDVAVLAPEAAGRSWWPASFLAPLAANEPGLASGLSAVEGLLDELQRAGVEPERTVLAGFSQGACLALEAAARLARPFHAVAALSGGLLGTGEADGAAHEGLYGHADKRFDYCGRLDGVPVLLGCHARDLHIPLTRVRRSAEVLEGMGAAVETMILPGAGHGVVAEEAAWLRGRLNGAPARPA